MQNWRESLAGVRPVRDALLWIPIFAGNLAAFVAGLTLAVQTAIAIWEDGGATAIAMLVVGALAGFAGVAVIAWVAWLPWAAVVALVAWLSGRGRTAKHPLATAPFPVLRARSRLANSVQERLGKPTWRKVLVVYLGLLAVELLAELISPSSVFTAHPLGEALKRSAILAAAQAFGLLLVAVPVAFTGQGALLALDRVRLLLVAWRDRRALEALADFAGFRPELTEGRAAVSGRAASLDGRSVVAPLSGEECLAFRLVGETAAYAIDDAEVAEMIVVTGDGEVAVRGEQHVVSLPEPEVEPMAPSSEQRERLASFFRARGLPQPAAELEIGESLLREGDHVVVHGAESSETVAGSGYRERGTRRVLDDGDELPVLIEREEPARLGV